MSILIIAILTVTRTIVASLPPSDENDNVLHIGGIFPIEGEGGWQGGQVSEISFTRCKWLFRELPRTLILPWDSLPN